MSDTTAPAQELAEFLAENLPDWRARWAGEDSFEAARDWQRIMQTGQWVAPEWSVENGGRGLDVLSALACAAVLAEHHVPRTAGIFGVNNVGPTIAAYGTPEQREHLPRILCGEEIWCQGFSEPGTGSDLAGLQTRAELDGDEFVINGQKVFISNGQLCDVVVLATKTDSAAGAQGVTLFLVESNRAGFKRGRNLEKLGMKAQDTSELFFDQVRVPASSMLGKEGRGFPQMMTQLPQERLAQAIRSATVTEAVIEWTVDYTAERRAFGQAIADFQNTQFVLADLKARSTMARVFTDKCIDLFMQGKLDPVDAAMVKMVTSELHCEAVDKCLQLFGGWGYMWEYPIARAYADARVVKIAGGSIEIMKTIIARDLFKNRLK